MFYTSAVALAAFVAYAAPASAQPVSGAIFTTLQDGWIVAYNDDTLEQLQDAEAGAAPDMTDAFALRASLGRLDECLARLDVAKRNCVLFAYLDGCTHVEIAERLQAPLGSVKAWIRRGVASLKECLA